LLTVHKESSRHDSTADRAAAHPDLGLKQQLKQQLKQRPFFPFQSISVPMRRRKRPLNEPPKRRLKSSNRLIRLPPR